MNIMAKKPIIYLLSALALTPAGSLHSEPVPQSSASQERVLLKMLKAPKALIATEIFGIRNCTALPAPTTKTPQLTPVEAHALESAFLKGPSVRNLRDSSILPAAQLYQSIRKTRNCIIIFEMPEAEKSFAITLEFSKDQKELTLLIQTRSESFPQTALHCAESAVMSAGWSTGKKVLVGAAALATTGAVLNALSPSKQATQPRNPLRGLGEGVAHINLADPATALAQKGHAPLANATPNASRVLPLPAHAEIIVEDGSDVDGALMDEAAPAGAVPRITIEEEEEEDAELTEASGEKLVELPQQRAPRGGHRGLTQGQGSRRVDALTTTRGVLSEEAYLDILRPYITDTKLALSNEERFFRITGKTQLFKAVNTDNDKALTEEIEHIHAALVWANKNPQSLQNQFRNANAQELLTAFLIFIGAKEYSDADEDPSYIGLASTSAARSSSLSFWTKGTQSFLEYNPSLLEICTRFGGPKVLQVAFRPYLENGVGLRVTIGYSDGVPHTLWSLLRHNFANKQGRVEHAYIVQMVSVMALGIGMHNKALKGINYEHIQLNTTGGDMKVAGSDICLSAQLTAVVPAGINHRDAICSDIKRIVSAAAGLQLSQDSLAVAEVGAGITRWETNMAKLVDQYESKRGALGYAAETVHRLADNVAGSVTALVLHRK